MQYCIIAINIPVYFPSGFYTLQVAPTHLSSLPSHITYVYMYISI